MVEDQKVETMKCKLCKQEITKCALTCSKGTICMKCSKDISLAELQPLNSHNDILWCIAETFFRKGRGENITFKDVWEENNNKLIKLEDVLNNQKGL